MGKHLEWYEAPLNQISPERCSEQEELLYYKQSPLHIYDFLSQRIHAQEEAVRTASLILWNHLNGRRSVNVFAGPTGSGKTHIWEVLKEIYNRIYLEDSSNYSKNGWQGDYGVTSVFERINPHGPAPIIVYDEIDKNVMCPQYTSGGDNVSQHLQGEMLALLQGKEILIKARNQSNIFNTAKATFILCGSFSAKAEEIADKANKAIGFNSTNHDMDAFSEPLSIDDLIDFGMTREIAGRVNRIVCLNNLNQSDYLSILRSSSCGPVPFFEKNYKTKIIISPEKEEEISAYAFEKKLGVRSMYSLIQQEIDNLIWSEEPIISPMLIC